MHEVRIRLGEVLRVAAADRYRPADGPVALRVTGVRLVVNRPEADGWVWVEGTRVTAGGRAGLPTQVLVRATLLGDDGSRR